MLTRSTGRKVVATGVAAVAFAFVHQVSVHDSRFAARQMVLREDTALPAPGTKLRFTATAYCKGTTTASGVNVRTGIAAADPDLLPVGSVIQVDRLGEKHNGIYTVMDTGPKVQGRHIDIYMWSCHEALALGRRPAHITVLRLGWNPKHSGDTIANRLFRQREASAAVHAVRPVAPPPPVVPTSGAVEPAKLEPPK
jgi:3D (Asp-Asp-Asp) domain-containing protein